jgi:hypothetical protein
VAIRSGGVTLHLSRSHVNSATAPIPLRCLIVEHAEIVSDSHQASATFKRLPGSHLTFSAIQTEYAGSQADTEGGLRGGSPGARHWLYLGPSSCQLFG